MIELVVIGMMLYCLQDYNHEQEQDKQIQEIRQIAIDNDADVLIWQNQYGKGTKKIEGINK